MSVSAVGCTFVHSLRKGEFPLNVLQTSQSLDCLCLFLAVWVTSILVAKGLRNAKIKD